MWRFWNCQFSFTDVGCYTVTSRVQRMLRRAFSGKSNCDMRCIEGLQAIHAFIKFIRLLFNIFETFVNEIIFSTQFPAEKYCTGCTNRKDEVIINRLRIGHTRLTHSFRMENRPRPPLCDQCEGDHELTVKHILIECHYLKIIRRRHYDVTDLNQLFETVSSKRILDFVKDIGLYNSL